MTATRKVAVLTTGRQDFGILRSTVVLLAKDAEFELSLWAGGMHLRERFGRAVEHLRSEGFHVARELPFIAEPPDAVFDAARAVEQVAAAIREEAPDAIVLTGDRVETLAAGLAATVERVPVVHLHGGEETEGAIDNACRHALTKLSHLHLVSLGVHAQRVIQMGEDPDRVEVVGAPGLDNIYRGDLPDRRRLAQALGFPLEPPVVLVTVHPTTLSEDPTGEVRAVSAAMERVDATYIVTQPNADAGGTEIRDFWGRWSAGRPAVRVVDALGETRYWGLLRIADAVLGNSSSGIIEAPSAGVPAINVGDRQRGRHRHPGTIDVPVVADEVEHALRRALSSGAKVQIRYMRGVYPEGPAAPRIVDAIRRWQPSMPPRKRFHRV